MEDILRYKKYEPFFGSWYFEKNQREIGSGSFGSVFKIVRHDTNVRPSALKIITIPGKKAELETLRFQGMNEEDMWHYYQQMADDIKKEYELMSDLKGCDNIVSCEDFKTFKRNDGLGFDIMIRMELLMPLIKYRAETKRKIGEGEIVKLGIDICQALERCQVNNIIHRDIKPENIFISQYGNFKLGDFGIARTIEKTDMLMSRKGTKNYMAPEVYNSQPYDRTADIYSLGIVLYQMLNDNCVPFLNTETAKSAAAREQAFIKRIKGHELERPLHGSDSLIEIILKACQFEKNKRYQEPKELRTELEKLTVSEIDMSGIDIFDASEDLTDDTEILQNDVGRSTSLLMGENKDEYTSLLNNNTDIATSLLRDNGQTELLKDNTKENLPVLSKILKNKKSKIILGAVTSVIILSGIIAGGIILKGNSQVESKQDNNVKTNDTNNNTKASNVNNSAKTGDEYIKEIVITSKTALVNPENNQQAYIFYDVLDQEGNSIRQSVDIVWTSSSSATVEADKKTGCLTLTKEGNDIFNYGNTIYLIGVNVVSGITQNAILSVGMDRVPDTVEFVGFINKNEKKILNEIPADFAKDKYFLLYNVYDQEGNPMEAGKEYLFSPEDTNKSLTFMSDAPRLISLNTNDNDIYTIDNEVYCLLGIQPGEDISSGGEVNLSIISNKTGTKKTKKLLISSDTVTINANNEIIDNSNQLTEEEQILNQRKSVTELKGEDLDKLSDLKDYENLEILDLSQTKTNNISVLADLKKLKELDISYTNIKDISVLENCKNLISLNISYNNENMTEKKIITTLSSMMQLKELDVTGNMVIGDYEENLPELENLEVLYAGSTGISNGNFLSKLKNLKILDLDSNLMFDNFKKISKLENIEELNISATGIAKLDGIEKMKKLKILNISLTDISDISMLKSLKNLEKVIVSESPEIKKQTKELKKVLKNCKFEIV